MNPKTAVNLLEKAVQFYVQQNLEVAANLYEFGLAVDDYAQECAKKRKLLREAIALVSRLVSEEIEK